MGQNFSSAGRVVRAIGAALLLAILMALPRSAVSQDKPSANLGSVLGELRRGGFVIYFRHTATDAVGAPDAQSDLNRCETQRTLSAKGRAQAAEIGAAIKALEIPVGSVTTSPFCRTKDTAQLVFGRYTVDNDLYFVISTDARETKRLTDSLRRMLSTPPAQGTNSVLVAHSANLREAAGIFAQPEGVAYVFRPLANGQYEMLATILPDEWSKAAERRR